MRSKIFFLTLLFIYTAIPGQSSYPAFSEIPASKKYNRPVEYYIKAAESNNEAYIELASFMKEQGEYNESIRYLRKYLRKENNKKARLLLGEVYYLNGEEKKALSVLRSLKIKGCNYEIYLYLGLIYEELNNTRLAVKYYTKSITYRENSISLYRLGKIFYNNGFYSKAAALFKTLIGYDASVRLAYYYLGDSYFKENYLKEAYKYFLKANNFYPKSTLIAGKLDLVKKRLGKEYFLARREKLLEKRKKVKLASYIPIRGNIPKVRVAVLEKVSAVSFKSSGKITLEYGNNAINLKSNRLYTIKTEGDSIVLRRYEDGSNTAYIKTPLALKSDAHPFYILGAVYGKGSFWQSTLDLSLRGELKIIEKGGYLTVINVLSVEEYLYGVLPAEIYPSTGFEALKAQAVAARTLVFKNLGRHKKEEFDFCSGVRCQVYRGMKEYPPTNKAVDATRGEVLVHEGKLIEAFYHSNCGGCLRSDAFGSRDYLENKLDTKTGGILELSPWNIERWFKDYPESFCHSLGHESNFRWQRVYDAEDFLIVYGAPLEELSKIDVVKRGQCAHIRSLYIEIASKRITLNRDLKIRRFFDNLRSSAFIIEVKYIRNGRGITPGLILFWGAGFGHGEGMCQQGAAAMAKDGYSYKEILKHYYKNVNIERMY